MIIALVSISLAVSAEAQARCETLPEPVHGEVRMDGVRYAASAGGLVVHDPLSGATQIKSACNGLAGTYLQAIALDPRGGVTLAIRGEGIWSYDPRTERHIQLVQDPRLRWPTALVWQEDALWVGTVQNGLWRVTREGSKVRLKQPVWRFRAHRVTSLLLDAHGALLVGRDLGGLWRVDARGRSKRLLKGSVQGLERVADTVVVNRGAERCRLGVKRRCHRIKETSIEASVSGRLPSAHLTSLAVHPGPEGVPRLWAGTFDAGVVWRDDQGRWRRPLAQGEPPRFVNTLSSDGTRLWAATATGAFVLEAGQWRRFGEQSGLPTDHINAIHLGDDAVWFATSHGLGKWDGERMHSVGQREGLPYRIVYSVATSGKQVLAGTAFGLGVYEDGAWRSVRMGTSGLSDDWVNAVAFRADGSALIGTYDAGVDRLAHTGVRAVEGLDAVWVNPSGIFPVDALEGVFVTTLGDGLWFWPDSGAPRRMRSGGSLPSQDVTAVQLYGGALWVATRNGLARWDMDDLGID